MINFLRTKFWFFQSSLAVTTTQISLDTLDAISVSHPIPVRTICNSRAPWVLSEKKSTSATFLLAREKLSILHFGMASCSAMNGKCAMGLFVLAASSILIYKYFTKRVKKSDKRRSSSTFIGEYFPPLPDEVVEVLRTSRLCYLATQSYGNPHLSLMNFTYCRDKEVIILSTRRNTKKFYQIVENPSVAVLIHDFQSQIVPSSPPTSTATDEERRNKQWSITLNGIAEVSSQNPWLLYNAFEVINLPRVFLLYLSNFHSWQTYFVGDIWWWRDDKILQVSNFVSISIPSIIVKVANPFEDTLLFFVTDIKCDKLTENSASLVRFSFSNTFPVLLWCRIPSVASLSISSKSWRTIHLENNPDYKQFIVGSDIAILVIHIDKARMCDVQDRVSYWNARDGICSTEALH